MTQLHVHLEESITATEFEKPAKKDSKTKKERKTKKDSKANDKSNGIQSVSRKNSESESETHPKADEIKG